MLFHPSPCWRSWRTEGPSRAGETQKSMQWISISLSAGVTSLTPELLWNEGFCNCPCNKAWVLWGVLYQESKVSSSLPGVEWAAQRGCRCPVPAGVQGQVGWSPGQPGLVNGEVGGLAQQGGWRFMILEVPSNPGHSVILWDMTFKTHSHHRELAISIQMTAPV